MRVLHVLDHSLPLQSGYVFRTLGLLEGQRKLGFETFHLTSPRHEAPVTADVETVDGWRFARTRCPTPSVRPILRELAEMRATTRRLGEVCDAVRPDVIHAHSPVLNGYPALWTARRRRLPLVYEIRAFWEDAAVDHGTTQTGSPRYRATRALETLLCRRADAIVTICEGLRQNLVARGIQPGKITVVPNAVDAARFATVGEAKTALVERLGLTGCRVLGFIGSFYAYEGLKLLIEAMPAILAEQPKTRLLLVGGGPDEAAIRARVAALGLEQAVVFTGRVPHGEVLDYYGLVDLFVFPRLTMPLTELVTPLKPLEAMAAGRPIVASDVGGHKELIEDGRTGFLFPAGSIEALAACLIASLRDAERWPEIVVEGRKFAEVRRWDRVSLNYKPLFESLSSPRRAAPDADGDRQVATR